MKKIIIGVLFLLLGIGFYFWMMKPSVGKIKRGGMVNNPGEIIEWQKYQGRSFSFEYPPQLLISRSEEKKAIFYGVSGVSWQLVVMERTVAGGMEELSDIKMRTVKSDTYEEFSIDDKICFMNKTSWERVCWLKNGERVLSLALMANTNDPRLEADFERMVRSVVMN